MNNPDKEPRKRHFLIVFLFAILASMGYLFSRLKPEERKKLVDKVSDLRKSGVSTIVRFCIPHESNEFKPHIFHKKSVKNILLIVIAVKVITVSTLFILYPNQARLVQDIKAKMYELINVYREEQGQIPLEPNEYLETVASQKAVDMIEQNYFSHYGIDGKTPWQWLDTSVYPYTAMGENLAMDFLTAQSVLGAFQKSPTHDKNLVSEKYSHIGIAVQSGFLDGHDTNLMVVFFAHPKVITTATQLAQAPAPTTIVPEPVPVTAPVEETPNDIVPEPETVPVQPNPVPEEKVTPDVIEPDVENIPEPEQVAVQQPSPATTTATIIERLHDTPGAQVLGQSIPDAGIALENFTQGMTLSDGTLLQRMVRWSNRFFTVTLLALIILLIINIFVKVRIQHAPVIINAMFLIVVVAGLLYFNVHRAEALGEHVRILGVLFGL